MKKGCILYIVLFCVCLGMSAQWTGNSLSDSAKAYIIISSPPQWDESIESCFGHVSFWFTDEADSVDITLSYNKDVALANPFFIPYLWYDLQRIVVNVGGESYFRQAKEEGRCLTICRLNLSASEMNLIYRSLWNERVNSNRVGYSFLQLNCSGASFQLIDSCAAVCWPNRPHAQSYHDMFYGHASAYPSICFLISLFEVPYFYEYNSLSESMYAPECFLERLKGASVGRGGNSPVPLVSGIEVVDYSDGNGQAVFDRSSGYATPLAVLIVFIALAVLFAAALFIPRLTIPLGLSFFFFMGTMGLLLWVLSFMLSAPEYRPMSNIHLWLFSPLPLIFAIAWSVPAIRRCTSIIKACLGLQLWVDTTYLVLSVYAPQRVHFLLVATALLFAAWCMVLLKKIHQHIIN